MPWTNAAYDSLACLVAARTGLTFPASRGDSTKEGLRRAMARAQITDPNDYLQRLQLDAALFDDLIGELTIGETYFFREPAQFAFIRPEMLAKVRARKGGAQRFRAWSAGCASGEEAYSLAIVFEEEGLAEARVLATDICQAALERARQASYTKWSLRGEGATVALPYLSRRDDRYVVHEQIRRRVTFEQLNLALDVYPSFATGTCGLDLIMCRNVMIYFDAPTVRAVARRLFEFTIVVTDAGVLYRREPAGAASVKAPVGAMTSQGLATGQRAEAERPDLAAAATARDHRKQTTRKLRGQRTPTKSAPTKSATGREGRVAEARAALARGDYATSAAFARREPDNPVTKSLEVRALANMNLTEAERTCRQAALHYPLVPEFHYLHSILLLELGDSAEAIRAVRRAIYLDSSLALAHFTLGSILQRLGEIKEARRAYRNARDLCISRPADEVVPLSDGELNGRLAEAAAAQMVALEAAEAIV
jgi:chemotaxis protein methyltransferase CheR